MPLPPQSASGSVLTETLIIDANGTRWGLVPSMSAGLQVVRGTTIDMATANVAQMLYWSHTVYYVTTGNAWFLWTGSNWTATTDPRAQAESPDGTTIPPAASITDAIDVTWTLTSGGQTARNGAIDTSLSGVVLLLIHSHAIYAEDNAGGWHQWTGSVWTLIAGDPRGPGVSESSDGTAVTTAGPIIYASQTPGQAGGPSFDQFAINGANHVTRNGVADTSGGTVTELYYHLHTVYLLNATGWFSWNGSVWIAAASPLPPVESAEGTVIAAPGAVLYASSIMGQAAGASPLITWALTAANGQIIQNGTVQTATAAVIQLYYHNHTVYQQAANGNAFGTPGWWYWNSTAWTACASPIAAAESAAGTAVTTVGPSIWASPTPGSPPAAGVTLDQWQLNTSGQIVRNGTIAPATASVTELYYTNHTLYQQASNGNSFGTPGWWYWNATGWIACPSPLPASPTIGVASPGQQTVGNTGAISGSIGGYSAPPGLQYADAGGAWAPLPPGAIVTAGAFSFTHPAWATPNASMTVAVRDANATGIIGTSPSFAIVAPITLTGITINGGTAPITVPAGSAAGTAIGVVAVSTTGGTFAGSLALSGADGARFSLPGTNAQVATAIILSAGTYTITVTATEPGATGSPLSQDFTIIAVAGTTAGRVATMLEGIGFNAFTAGQDGSTPSAAQYTAAVDYLTAGTGMGLTCRIYDNGTDQSPLPLAVSAQRPAVLWGVAWSQGSALPSSTVPGTLFADEFDGPLSLFDYTHPGNGGTWCPGGASLGEEAGIPIGDSWLVNPFNPATPISGIFTVAGSVLSALCEPMPANIAAAAGNKLWACGTLHTGHSFNAQYGYIECRAKLPGNVPGLGGSIWLLPANGSWPPEIDINEWGGISGGPNQWHGVAIIGTSSALQEWPGTTWRNMDQSSAFHTYGFEWTAATCTWYIDDVAVISGATPAQLKQPMYAILQMNTGDSSGSFGNGPITNPSLLPAAAQYDWFRWWPDRATAVAAGDPPSTFFTAADALAAAGALAWAEGPNEPNNSLSGGGTQLSASNALTFQQAIAARYRPQAVGVLGPALADTSASYPSDYWSTSLAGVVAAADGWAGHDYPTAGAPSRDMWRRSAMLAAAGFRSPGAITEFHPGIKQAAGTPSDATQGYWTLCAVLAGTKWFNARALAWWSLFDYSGGAAAGLFNAYDTAQPRGPAKALHALFALCRDASSIRHSFTPPARNVAVSGLPAAWAGQGGMPSGGGQWLYVAGSDGREYIFVWDEEDALAIGSTHAVTVDLGTSCASVVDYSLTNPQTDTPAAIQTLSNVSSVSMALTTEVRVLVIRAAALVASPDGTTLNSAAGQIVGSAGDTWAFVALPTLTVARNGVPDPSTSAGRTLLYWGSSVYFQGTVSSAAGWWQYSGGTWHASADPRVSAASITAITLAGGAGPVTIANGSPPGTLIGPIAVAMSDASVFSGSLAYAGTTGLTIAPGNNLRTATTAATLFADEFTSGTWISHRTWQSGDLWGLVSTDIPDGRGGPAMNEGGSQFWINPNNPSTPVAGVYAVTGGQLVLGLVNTPSGSQTYIDGLAGAHMPFCGALINNRNTLNRLFGCYQFSAQAEIEPGFVYQWTLESMGPWQSEIDVMIGTRPDGVQQLSFALSGALIFDAQVVYSDTTLDYTKPHDFIVDWQADFISFLVDGRQVYQISTAQATATYGNFATAPMFTYQLTAANYQSPYQVDPNPAHLPKVARVDYHRVYATRPAALAAGNYAAAITATEGASAMTVNFQVIVAAAQGVTLTGISLSGTTVAAGAAPPIAVGTITVQTNGGAFSGTLAGSDATHFAIRSGELDTAATLAAGSFPETITATMAGAAGSPLAKAFTIIAASSGVGPVVSGSMVTADFGAQQNYSGRSGVQQIVDKRMWGLSTGGACRNFDTAFTPGWGTFASSAYRSGYAAVDAPLWRLNGNNAGRMFNSDGSVAAAWWANLLQYFPLTNPGGDSAWIIGANPSVFAEGSANAGSDPTTFANRMAGLARYFKTTPMSNGKLLPVIGYEGPNEPGSDGSTLNSFYGPLRSAIKAVDSSLLICGTVQSYAGQGGTDAACFNNLDWLDAHEYEGGSDPVTGCWSSTRGTDDMANENGVMGTNYKPFFLGEWNIDYNCSAASMQNYVGAVYGGKILTQYLDASRAAFTAAIWDAAIDGNCGVVNSDGSVAPVGRVLGTARKAIFGPRVQVAASGLIPIGCVPAAGRIGLMLTNVGGARSGSIGLSRWPVNISGNGTINLFQLTSGNQQGATSTLTVSGGVTGSVSCPTGSVTILWN